MMDPVLGHDAGTDGIDVRCMRDAGWHAVDAYADAYGLTVHGRTHHQMHVARVKAIEHAGVAHVRRATFCVIVHAPGVQQVRSVRFVQ
jgi:hypothetical protein